MTLWESSAARFSTPDGACLILEVVLPSLTYTHELSRYHAGAGERRSKGTTVSGVVSDTAFKAMLAAYESNEADVVDDRHDAYCTISTYPAGGLTADIYLRSGSAAAGGLTADKPAG